MSKIKSKLFIISILVFLSGCSFIVEQRLAMGDEVHQQKDVKIKTKDTTPGLFSK